mgnify:CR=1 FL=1|jgi:hypothetical protein
MMYATNDDLINLIGGEIFDHGRDDFTSELTRAESDVNRYIEVNWFQKTRGGSSKRIVTVGETFDATKLSAAQWKTSTIYLALYRYILPQLSPFRGEDSFTHKISFYKERYFEEIKEVMASGIEYDSNDDGTITENEVYEHRQDRVYR